MATTWFNKKGQTVTVDTLKLSFVDFSINQNIMKVIFSITVLKLKMEIQNANYKSFLAAMEERLGFISLEQNAMFTGQLICNEYSISSSFCTHY